MSSEALYKARWAYKPGYKLSPEESDALNFGWAAALKFMSSPRMPAPSTGTPLPTAPTTGEPIPLVAFYTDAP